MNSSSSTRSKIKLLAVMEPKTVTGAAKNMLDFCRAARELEETLPGSTTIETSFLTFERAFKFGSAGKRPNEFVEAVRKLGLEVDIIAERFRFDLGVLQLLRQIVASRAPDIVLTHHCKSHFLLKLSGLRQRYPWVAFHHGYTKTSRRERIYNWMDHLSLPSAHQVITVCHAFARELANVGVAPERIHVQHNAIRFEQPPISEEVNSLKAQLAIASDERLVLAIGRLSSEKAHVDLISAIRYLNEIHPQNKARFVIVGEGPERRRLEGKAASLGLSNHVTFVGQTNNVKPYYAAADLFVLPSHSEGSPYVLLEAMAAGVPIVATAVGGVPEMVVNNESALLVPAHNPRAMAEGIGNVLIDTNLARALVANASARVSANYSPEKYVRALVDIYGTILSDGSRPHQ
jgi:glycosyltransferase involved in cell wall biosynthesis